MGANSNKDGMSFFLPSSLYKTNRLHVTVGLFSSNRSQKTSKCAKNISDALTSGSRVGSHANVLRGSPLTI